MKIALVINSLGMGGAERVLSLMANYFGENGHQVTLVTLDDGGDIAYPLSSHVRRYSLDLARDTYSAGGALLRNWYVIHRLRHTLLALNPECTISFLYETNINVLLATLFLPHVLIISERNDPRHKKARRAVWSVLRRALYPLAHHLVVQNRDARNWFRRYNKSIPIIPNPVRVSPQELAAEPEIPLPPGNRIIAMGSLVYQKGFDLLIKVFKRLHQAYPEWRLVIIGSGPLEHTLRLETQRLGIAESVYLPGQVMNPFAVFARCDLFVLSSRYEGFPNVLLEAMACGLAVVSFDCPSGPNDIIEHERNGLLVSPEDTIGLEQAMDGLMQDKAKRRMLGECAQQVMQKYAVDTVMQQWEALMPMDRSAT